MRYKGGNTCTDSISDKAQCTDVFNGRTYCARSLRVNVVCNNRISDIPPVEEVSEKRGCEYSVTLNSIYGCPVECPRNEDELVCSNRGVCAYDGVESGYTVDGDVGAARCLCKAPWSGPACDVALASEEADAAEAPPERKGATFWVGLAMLVTGLGLVAYARQFQIEAFCGGLAKCFSRRRGLVEMANKGGYQAADEAQSPLTGDYATFE